jgi:hypothetical protein
MYLIGTCMAYFQTEVLIAKAFLNRSEGKQANCESRQAVAVQAYRVFCPSFQVDGTYF